MWLKLMLQAFGRMNTQICEYSQYGRRTTAGMQKHMSPVGVSGIWSLTKEGDESCQEGDDHIVHQSDAEAGKEIALAEA